MVATLKDEWLKGQKERFHSYICNLNVTVIDVWFRFYTKEEENFLWSLYAAEGEDKSHYLFGNN